MRNDHQDALSAGLAVSEYAPGGKSADEIRGLWQWIEARLGNAGSRPATNRSSRSSGCDTFPRFFAEMACEARLAFEHPTGAALS